MQTDSRGSEAGGQTLDGESIIFEPEQVCIGDSDEDKKGTGTSGK